ncbi:hypothetical protein FIV42_03470 [Persicimonas caeni]|uniref:YbbR-like domain-containing protein n=1 Tax=Persicimonas caeni TaxID=2292766 RepID=A0A4Y6PNK7_PERCE|nr:CdaR family protein [Persicimonas caeni]QDG49830.1 hypothetical protein FIV42_03470 [Persicimonas caeni]QED31051.1 hypothetical protein FRD00_03465 [Persicimonas caeni]
MLETLDRIIRQTFVRNLHLKVIALLLTLALYLWVSVDREVERTRYAPLRLDVPSYMVLVNDPPNRAAVTVRGKWSDLAQLESAELDSIRLEVDPSMGRSGRISLTPDMVDLPPGLRAIDIEPNLVQFRLEEKQRKRVTVRPKIVGQPEAGYDFKEASVTPEAVEVSGPANSLDELASVGTEPISLSGQRKSFTKQVRPRIDDPLVDFHLDRPLEVTVRLDAQEVERKFEDVKVVPSHHDGALVTSIEPTHVDITVRGPKAVVDEVAKEELLASVDLSDQSAGRSTTVLKEVQIHNVPSGVQIIRKQPNTFRIRMHPKEPAQQARD